MSTSTTTATTATTIQATATAATPSMNSLPQPTTPTPATTAAATTAPLLPSNSPKLTSPTASHSPPSNAEERAACGGPTTTSPNNNNTNIDRSSGTSIAAAPGTAADAGQSPDTPTSALPRTSLYDGASGSGGGGESDGASSSAHEECSESSLRAAAAAAAAHQPTLNIGTLGHVAHGKTTIVRQLTGQDPMKFKSEKGNSCTIKLGYANAKIWKCPTCPSPNSYSSTAGSAAAPQPCKHCGGSPTLARHISFVDCPGHEVLMATMLAGAAVMDSALLVVAASDVCPQPQTAEHLVAAEIMGLTSLTIAQNKVDVAGSRAAASEHAESIRAFVAGTCAQDAPIIPVSASIGINIDALLAYLAELPEPARPLSGPTRMYCIRSFDVNRPGTTIDQLKGGVAGGSIVSGTVHIGDELEIRPGIITRDTRGNVFSMPLTTTVTSLMSDSNTLDVAFPGGLVAVGTNLDPAYTRSNRLVGHVIGTPGSLPPTYVSLTLRIKYMKRLVAGVAGEKGAKVARFDTGDRVLLSIGSATQKGTVAKSKERGTHLTITLDKPTCTEIGEKVAVSAQNNGRQWRLAGWADMLSGDEACEGLAPTN